MSVKTKFSIILLSLFFFLSTILYFSFFFNLKSEEVLGGSDNDIFYSATATTDGLIAVGYTKSSDGDFKDIENKGLRDALIAKYSIKDKILWVKTIGGNGNDYFKSIIKTSDGYITVGGSQSTTDEFKGLNKGYDDTIISKFDEEGNNLWLKIFGGNKKDILESVIEVSDGYIGVGCSNSNDIINNKGDFDGIIIKFDKEGNKLWVKNYGGSKIDKFTSIIKDDDKLIITGSSNSNDHDFDKLNNGSNNGIVLKTDIDGNIISTINIGGNNNDLISSIIKIPDGFIAIGSTESNDIVNNSGKIDGLITKIDNDMNIIWVKSFGTKGNDFFNSAILSNNEIIVVGDSNQDINTVNTNDSDAIIIKYNLDGKKLSEKRIDGNDYDSFLSINIINDNYYIVGHSYSNKYKKESNYSNNDTNAIIIKR